MCRIGDPKPPNSIFDYVISGRSHTSHVNLKITKILVLYASDAYVCTYLLVYQTYASRALMFKSFLN